MPSHRPEDDGTGHCRYCARQVKVYQRPSPGLQHVRGRIAGVSPLRLADGARRPAPVSKPRRQAAAYQPVARGSRYDFWWLYDPPGEDQPLGTRRRD